MRGQLFLYKNQVITSFLLLNNDKYFHFCIIPLIFLNNRL